MLRLYSPDELETGEELMYIPRYDSVRPVNEESDPVEGEKTNIYLRGGRLSEHVCPWSFSIS